MKTKQQTNKTTRIAAILMVLAMITTCGLTGTLAKYISSASADTQYARAAAWKILDWNDDVLGTNTLLLLNPNMKTHGIAQAQEDDGTGTWSVTESSVKPNPESYTYGFSKDASHMIIAPGTGGYQNIYITNASEVPATLSIDLGSGAGGSNLARVKLLVTDDASVTDLASAVTFGANGNLNTGVPAAGSSVTVDPGKKSDAISIAWWWEFSPNDTVASDVSGDTAVGTAEAATENDDVLATLSSAKIVVSQID